MPENEQSKVVTQKYIGIDVLSVVVKKGKTTERTINLYWGEPVRVESEGDGAELTMLLDLHAPEPLRVKVPADLLKAEGLLGVRFLDVGQGDGAILTSPSGKRVIVDGGREDHMRRYVCAAYRAEVQRGGLPCEALVVTHGDDDHVGGLSEMLFGVPQPYSPDWPVLRPERVFHNGLVKRPSKVGDAAMLGPTVKDGDTTYLVELNEDVRETPADDQLNQPFRRWRAALKTARSSSGAPPTVARLARGDGHRFDFLAEDGVRVEVLGPIVETLSSGRPGLRCFGDTRDNGISTSQTINGNSLVLRVVYGNVRLLLCGDLTAAGARRLLAQTAAEGGDLTAEVFKVPHHGTSDFSTELIAAVKPVVSVISSGDEGEGTEYIHPRAEQLGALGRHARAGLEKPLIFITELVAFLTRVRPEDGNSLRLYKKTTFGIVHVRTDGRRLLVVTPSGKTDAFEAYAFTVAADGTVKPTGVEKARVEVQRG